MTTTRTELTFGTITLRALPDYPDYWAGNDGWIYSTKKRQVPRRLARQYNKQTKMYVVSLYRPDRRYDRLRDGVVYSCLLPQPLAIHGLIASVWLPPRPSPAHQIDHKDERHENNRPDNLRWLTNQGNIGAYFENHPLAVAGENNPMAKLTEDEAAELISLQGRISQREAAKRFGLSRNQVGRIWRGHGWTHLPR